MQQQPAEFEWKWALAHGAVGFVVIMLLMIAAATIGRVDDPESFGRSSAKVAGIGMLATFGVSWLYQTRRKPLAAVAACLVLAFPIALVVLASRVHVPEGDLVRSAGVLRHSALGFSVPDPGQEFAKLTDEEFPRIRGMQRWAYAEEVSGDAVIIGVVPDGPTDEAELENIWTQPSVGSATRRHGSRSTHESANAGCDGPNAMRTPTSRAMGSIPVSTCSLSPRERLSC